MTRADLLLVLGISASLTAHALARSLQAVPDDGKREFTVSGCLLRAGYASYKLEDAKVDEVDGKALPAPIDPTIARLKIWSLDGGGNLGPRAGEKVQVVGRTEWKASDESDGPAAKPPVLEVKSVKTLASSCS